MVSFIHDIQAYRNDKPLKSDYIVHGINDSYIMRLSLTFSFYVLFLDQKYRYRIKYVIYFQCVLCLWNPENSSYI